MNCDQFQSRMDSLLDSRQDLTQDRLLKRHTESCPSCEERLHVWSSISDVISVEVAAKMQSDRNRSPVLMTVLKTHPLASVVAIAAVTLLFVSIGRWRLPLKSSASQQVASKTLESTAPTTPLNAGDIEEILVAATPQARLPWQPDGWWTTMPDEQWVHDTMPGVISVGQGVAPIGRSMKQAIAILMIYSRPPNANSSSVSPTVEPEPFSEQSSNGIPPHLLATWT